MCLQGASPPLTEQAHNTPHPTPGLLPGEPQYRLGAWRKGKPTWPMGPGARASWRCPGTGMAAQRRGAGVGIGAGEVGVESEKGHPRQSCFCPSPTLAQPQLFGLPPTPYPAHQGGP